MGGNASRAAFILFSSGVIFVTASGTVARSILPLFASRGNVSRVPGGCIGANAFLRVSQHEPYRAD